MKNRYVLVTPARDEERFIAKTIQSVIGQTIVPQEWIIVNDGSVDRTAEVVREHIEGHRWIRLIELSDRKQRKFGGAIVEAFNHGLRNLRAADYEFISKLDADLSLPPNYFEFLFQKFDENPRLGIASGCTFIRRGGRLVWERAYKNHTRGAMKVYRRECFEGMDGLVAQLGWDVIDDFKAQASGWETRSFRDLVVIHHRPMGASGKGLIAGKIRWGEIQYLLNYHPVFAFGSGLYRMFERPYIIGGLAMWYGYLRSSLDGKARIASGELGELVRRRQMERLKGVVTALASLVGRHRRGRPM